MLAEGTDPQRGAAAWQKYLDANPPAPFAKAAKARMTSRGGARKP